LKYSIVTRK